MTFFHLDPRSGDPQFCEIALGGSCPLGFNSAEHFEREETARKHFEEIMADYTIPKPLKRSDLT